MNLKDFDFELDKTLIAEKQLEKRDQSRLMILDNRKITHETTDEIIEKNFLNCVEHINPNDLLILNNSKVIKSRIILNEKIELYLNKKVSDLTWTSFAKPAKKLNVGDKFYFDNNYIIIKEKLDSGEILVEFILDSINDYTFFDKYGHMPIPPYIKRKAPVEDDNKNYQTVYAKEIGSVAAPTAGLHFTDELLKKIKAKGVEIDYVTLHVGAGTFLPIKTENLDNHVMHEENCYVSAELIEKIKKTKLRGGKVISVGTTTLRALESAFLFNKTGSFNTNIFIKNSFEFKSTDVLITNFHLPKSTLLILVCAFGGYKQIMNAYKIATEKKYRFFSYGDAMMIFKK
jgi:S-adenosylmethionine:tRNA ribosyltransferase-isomerase